MSFYDRQDIGAIICRHRREKELSQQQVAILVKHHFPDVHCSQATLSDIENGQQEISLGQLGALAVILELPINYFYKPSAVERDSFNTSPNDLK